MSASRVIIECWTCGKEFKWRKDCKEHINKEHNGEGLISMSEY